MLFDQNKPINTTIGELIDVIGVAAAHNCPEGLERIVLPTIADIVLVTGAHYDGIMPMDLSDLETARACRGWMDKAIRKEE